MHRCFAFCAWRAEPASAALGNYIGKGGRKHKCKCVRVFMCYTRGNEMNVYDPALCVSETQRKTRSPIHTKKTTLLGNRRVRDRDRDRESELNAKRRAMSSCWPIRSAEAVRKGYAMLHIQKPRVRKPRARPMWLYII